MFIVDDSLGYYNIPEDFGKAKEYLDERTVLNTLQQLHI